MVKAVLLTMLRFAEQMGMDYETRELALECYTELLELLDFMHLPGVLLKQAECLLNLVKLHYNKLYRQHNTKQTSGWKNEKAKKNRCQSYPQFVLFPYIFYQTILNNVFLTSYLFAALGKTRTIIVIQSKSNQLHKFLFC